MSKPEKRFGEHVNDDIIREILREHASREKPIGKSKIEKHANDKGYIIKHNRHR